MIASNLYLINKPIKYKKSYFLEEELLDVILRITHLTKSKIISFLDLGYDNKIY